MIELLAHMALVQVAETLRIQRPRIDVDKAAYAVDSDRLPVNALCER